MKVIGIDVSKSKFDVCMGVETPERELKVVARRSFDNTKSGFKELKSWLKSHKYDGDRLAVMEATGVYYENLIDFLYSISEPVSVVLAKSVRDFAKSENVKTKNDRLDALVIAMFAQSKFYRLPRWIPMSKHLSKLRAYSREIESYTKTGTALKNQLHSMECSSWTPKDVISQQKKLIKVVDETRDKMIKCLVDTAKSDPEFYAKVQKISKIKGLGDVTVIRVLAETNGFALCKNIRQAVSYAGLDVSSYESGIVSRPGKISKQGNRRIRCLLYMPTLVAMRKDKNVKAIYDRVNSRNPHTKQKGVVAAMRKTLILIYALWKNGEEYDPNHNIKQENNGKTYSSKPIAEHNPQPETSDNEEPESSFGSPKANKKSRSKGTVSSLTCTR